MIEFVKYLIFPKKCPYCHQVINRDMTECIVCRAGFPKYPRIEPLPSGEVCIAPFTYQDTFREALIHYKFHGKKFYAKSFSSALSQTIAEVYKDMSFEVITSVPLSAKRKKERGFDQAEFIAAETAKKIGKSYERLLLKNVDNAPQHNLPVEDKEQNVLGVYSVPDPEKVKNRKILLIDDITTTGHTMSECCKMLKHSGADRILCAAVAIAVPETPAGRSRFKNRKKNWE